MYLSVVGESEKSQVINDLKLFSFIFFVIIALVFLYRFVIYPLLPESIRYMDGLIHSDGLGYHNYALAFISGQEWEPGDPNTFVPTILVFLYQTLGVIDSFVYTLCIIVPIASIAFYFLYKSVVDISGDGVLTRVLFFAISMNPYNLLLLTQPGKDLFSLFSMAILLYFFTSFFYVSRRIKILGWVLLVTGLFVVNEVRSYQIYILLCGWVFGCLVVSILGNKKKVFKTLGIMCFLIISPKLPVYFPHFASSIGEFVEIELVEIEPVEIDQAVSDHIKAYSEVSREKFNIGILGKVNQYREFYINAAPNSSMIIYSDHRFDDMVDYLTFLPKAVLMIAIEPNPVRILSTGRGYHVTALKLAFLPWSIAATLCLCLFTLGFLCYPAIGMRMLPLIVLIGFWFLPYAYFMPNAGNVARYSSYITLLLPCAFIQVFVARFRNGD